MAAMVAAAIVVLAVVVMRWRSRSQRALVETLRSQVVERDVELRDHRFERADQQQAHDGDRAKLAGALRLLEGYGHEVPDWLRDDPLRSGS